MDSLPLDERSAPAGALARWGGSADAPAFEQAYRAESVFACERGVRIANWLGIALTPALVLLDFKMAPATAPLFLWFRLAGLVVLSAVQGLLYTPLGQGHPHRLGLIGAGTSVGLAVLLTAFSGGYDSPYNPGVSVTILVAALLVPWSPAWTLRVCGLAASFLVLRAFVVPASGQYVFGSLFGFVTACVIAVLATVGRERARHRGFELRWTLARLVERLERAERLRSEFLGAVSHELRTPLQVVLGFAEMLREPAFDAPTRAGFIDRIEHAGRELLDCIDSTLTVARIEAGHEEVRPHAVWLPVFWRDVQDHCEPIPRAPTVEVVWTDAPAVELHTDSRHLAVILRNLVSNAIKFTAEGSVRVGVQEQGESVTFQVSDTGIGIPAEAREAVFEMFRQLDGSDGRRYGGVGLGLYIVRRFVQRLGGTVTVESAAGAGSTFRVTIPKTLPAVHPARGSAAHTPPGSAVNGS